MENLLPIVILILVFLLFGALLALAILTYNYFSLRSRTQSWINEQADRSFRSWQQREIESVRAQQLEIAHSETKVQFENWKIEYEQQIRQDAIQRSQSVTVGKITEHIVPYLPDFTYNPKDVRFIGSPIDLVVFDGLNEGEVRKVIFVEIKTGESSLSTRERRVRDAIESGNVQWLELRPSMMGNPTQSSAGV